MVYAIAIGLQATDGSSLSSFRTVAQMMIHSTAPQQFLGVHCVWGTKKYVPVSRHVLRLTAWLCHTQQG
jgi:hypothetical protein